MSFAPQELRRLLAPQEAMHGAVVAIQDGRARIATKRGAVMASSLDDLKVGDRVTIRNGIANRTPAAVVVYPV